MSQTQYNQDVPERDVIANHLRTLMSKIIAQLEELDIEGPKFAPVDLPNLDRVKTEAYVLESTDVDRKATNPPFAPIERAGLVMTRVTDRQMPANISAETFKAQGKSTAGVGVPAQGATFSVVHLSVMVHPRSPHAPGCHGNWRYFETRDAENKLTNWWFGGAANLMPTLLYDEDCVSFHQTLKKHANTHGEDTYDAMKGWCDQYFHNRYRNETVGTGGIFYDNLSSHPNPKLDTRDAATNRPKSTEECVAFFKSIGDAWIEAYTPILKNRALETWTDEERTAQLIRRGHLCEHFMMVDLGFAFGMATGTGSLDAMRVILPETAQWKHTYKKTPTPPKAAALVQVLQSPKSWV